MRGIALASLLLAIDTCAANAADAIGGWSVEFRQDTFTGEVYPAAKLTESVDGFVSRASLAAACIGGKRFVLGFFDGEVFSFDSTLSVDFKAASGVQSFTFKSKDIPRGTVSKYLDTEASKALQAVLSGATEIPFRTGTKQGVFKPIGSDRAFAIMGELCP